MMMTPFVFVLLVVVRASGGLAPLPTADALCPEGMPADWLPRCLAGQLAYSPTLSGGLMPEVGNGHVATVVQSDTIYAAGVFNGDALAKFSHSTYRARIPAFVVEVAHASTIGVRAMDFERATFVQRRNFSTNASESVIVVEERWYAPYQEPRLLVHEISLALVGGGVGATFEVSLSCEATAPSADIDLHSVPAAAEGEYAVIGNTTIPDLGNATAVGFAANVLPKTVTLVSGAPFTTLHALTAVVSSLNSTDVASDALHTLRGALAPAVVATLHEGHQAAWEARSEAGRLEVEGELVRQLASN